MQLPFFDFTDASIFLAISEIILLVTAQISPAFIRLTDTVVDKKKLDNAAIITGVMFLATVVIRVMSVILGL
jgi:hypothetical protein